MSGVILLVCALAIGANGLNLGIDFESGTRIKTAVEQAATEPGPRHHRAGRARRREDPAGHEQELGETSSRSPPGSSGRLRSPRSAPTSTRRSAAPELLVEPDRPDLRPGRRRQRHRRDHRVAARHRAYIALRFEWKYAVPVLVAVMHDLLITAGVYALLGLEVTTATVAALLTVLGFSLYDTIIVFDRVRENVPRMPRGGLHPDRQPLDVRGPGPFAGHQLLPGLPVLALLLFGGETLQAFASRCSSGPSRAPTRRCSSPRRCSRLEAARARLPPAHPAHPRGERRHRAPPTRSAAARAMST